MLVDNRGKVHAELVSPNSSGKENQSMVQKEQAKDVGEGCPRCLELEEAIRKASKVSSVEQLAESEIKVTIFKDKYDETRSVMQESGDLFHIIVDSINRTLVRAEVDSKDEIIADECHSLETSKMYYLKGMKVTSLNLYKQDVVGNELSARTISRREIRGSTL